MKRSTPIRARGLRHLRGQAMVELALVLPLFLMVLFGIIILGVGLFYQQQVTNAAREAARYAAIHTATAQRSVVGHLDPDSVDAGGYLGTYAPPTTYVRYYTPDNNWEVDGQGMTPAGRARIFGLDPQAVQVAACWSSYHNPSVQLFDAPPDGDYEILGQPVTIDSTWAQCEIDGHDPTTETNEIGCNGDLVTTDTGSSMSEGPTVIIGNRVTAYACYVWAPPLAGFLLIPETVTLRAVVTEPLQRQQ